MLNMYGDLYKIVLCSIYVAVGKSKHWLVKNTELLDSSASPLLSVLFLEKDGHLITGSADGQVSDWDTRPRKTQNQRFAFISKSFRAHGCFRCGAFLLAMALSATWWKKWICWRWKEGIKGAKRYWATMLVMLSSTGWDGDYHFSLQCYSALGCFFSSSWGATRKRGGIKTCHFNGFMWPVYRHQYWPKNVSKHTKAADVRS